jgi:hypothetical protein
MKNILKLIFVIPVVTILLSGCNDDDETTTQNAKTFVINATNYSSWAYFSFENGDTLAVNDPTDTTSWDIAFQRYMVKTNGGKSGSGQAAAFNSKLVGQSGFNTLISVPDSATYTTDDTVKVEGYNSANPKVPLVNKYILNEPLYGWFTLKQGASSTLIPTDFIYVVKTATGKYAKLWIQSYYSDTDAKAGYIKIMYTYHKDGSKNLE